MIVLDILFDLIFVVLSFVALCGETGYAWILASSGGNAASAREIIHQIIYRTNEGVVTDFYNYIGADLKFWAIACIAFQFVYWIILRKHKTELGFLGKKTKKVSFARLVVISITFITLVAYRPIFMDMNTLVTKGVELKEEKHEVEKVEGDSSEEQTAESEVPEQTEFKIRMVGDILIHDNILKSCEVGDGTYDFKGIFSDTKELSSSADMAILNQETILGGRELGYSGYPAFCSPTELGDAEVDAGYDVILGATNHAMDRGIRGILDSVNFWKRTYPNVLLCGLHDSQEDANNLRIYEMGTTTKVKVAILNYTYGTNGIDIPADESYILDKLKEDKVIADLETARASADFVIVCPHWGTEYTYQPSAAQKYWAKIFADHGVDLILGAHPHVAQPMEWIEGADGHRTLCYYSVGNFVTGTSRTGAGVWKQLISQMADVTLVRNADGSVSIKEGTIIPLICHWEGGKYRVIPLSKYDDATAARNEIVRQDSSFSLEEAKKFVGM